MGHTKDGTDCRDYADRYFVSVYQSYQKLMENSNLTRAKVYFHPMIGEHFGMAVVEAMASGLIPVVPNVGGQTEFVPLKYHFSTIEERRQKRCRLLFMNRRLERDSNKQFRKQIFSVQLYK